MTLPKAIIVDLDGTLCDHSHRLHFVDSSALPTKEQFDKWMQPFIKNKTCPEWKPDYESFYNAMGEDKVNKWCSIIISSCFYQGWANVLFVTGRPEKYRHVTETWINKDHSTHFELWELFMRPDYLPPKGCDNPKECNECWKCSDHYPDHRPSHEVKKEIYFREIQGKYDVLFCLEDDPKCVEMYRELGLVCLDVGRK